MQIKIVGAGLAGLSSYKHLYKNYSDIEIFEKQSDFGGLSSSYAVDKYIFDYAGHFLHLEDNGIKDWILELMKNKLDTIERKSLIYSFDTFSQYPYQTNFFGLPDEVIIENLHGLIQARYENPDKIVNSFYDWILKYFGKGIAENFMVPYNTKLWTVHPREMNATWMGRFVPKPDIEAAIRGSLESSNKNIGYNAFFYYPKQEGIKAIPKAIHREIKTKIEFNSEISSIDLENQVIISQNNERIPYDVLINTMPLKELISKIQTVPSVIKDLSLKLKSTSLILLNLGLDESLYDFNWAYFPEKKFEFFRLGFYSNSSKAMAPNGKSSMYVEVSRNSNSNVGDTSKIFNKVIHQLIQEGLISSKEAIEVHDVKILDPAYIIPDLNRDAITKEIQSFLKGNNVFSIGRYGNWEYSAMEDALIWGRKVSELIKLKSCT